MQPAILWRPIKGQDIQCELCSHFCYLKPEQTGKCGVRINHKGRLYTLVKDKIAAIHLDPVEKKPLFHFLPGTSTLSIGTMGCNFDCVFCQNHALSQAPKLKQPIVGQNISSQELIEMAIKYQANSISYTYSEPTIFLELVLETARLSKEKNLKNIIVSNGFQSQTCLQELKNYIDAANIDLKSFQEDFYRKYCDANLKPILKNLETIKKMGWWLEITTLIIPELNDSSKELKQISSFIVTHLGKEVPWHISRYHPNYKLSNPPTPLSTLEKAYEIGKETGLEYVYIGNLPGHLTESTFCPNCQKVVIKRYGFQIQEYNLKQGKCKNCQTQIAGVFA
ncbi:AmmeMemoRadiSam system radical SAM enzyme [Desulfonauticus submarinus]